MVLREATDLTEASRMFAEMYSYPGYTLTEAEAHQRLTIMQAGPWRVTQARLDEKTVGFALWTDLIEYIFLRSFAIDRAARTGGLGKQFLAGLRQDIWPAGRQVRIEVADGGPRGFWEKLGFKAITTGMWLYDEAPA
ncbi:MAG: GNAT family N-acetyltransferase [Pseudomonadota bacterium]